MSEEEDFCSTTSGEEAEVKQHVSSNVIFHMQLERFHVFKAQDHEKGHFDCVIEINGKKLYCHKFVLATASETFNALLSDRWNKSNDNVIKIDNPYYTYECFYEFIAFLYSGFCTITNDNFQVLTDMAEYYGIHFLKQLCDVFVSQLTITLKNVEEMTEFIVKYSLEKSMENLKQYVIKNFKEIIKRPKFYGYTKSFMVFLSTVIELKKQPIFFNVICEWGRHHATIKRTELKDGNFSVYEYAKDQLVEILGNLDFYKMDFIFIKKFVVEKRVLFSPSYLYGIVAKCKKPGYDEDDCFDLLYWLAKEEAKKKQLKGTATIDNKMINMDEAIRSELADVVPEINFKYMSFKYLMDFVVEKGFDFSLVEVYENLGYSGYGNREEIAFKQVYELAKKQVSIQQNLSPSENFNLDNAIKKKLADVIPIVDFRKMSEQFLTDFVAANGFITVEQAQGVHDIYVEVENNGKTLIAVFKDKFGIYETVQRSIRHTNFFKFLSLKQKPRSWNKYCLCHNSTFKVPSISSSSVMKMKGVQWYLCFEANGNLTVKHQSLIDRNDFLIAEMRSKSNENFAFNTDENAKILTYYKNVCFV